MKNKVGIIGFGKMGKIREKTIKESKIADIKAIYDPEYKGSKEHNFVDTESEIFKDPDIDSIIIATPNYLNKRLTIQGLSCGKNVFCEKPPAFTARDIEEVIEVENASGKKLMYGFNHRYHRSVLRMRDEIASKQYGNVLWMRGRYGKSVDKNFFHQWRSQKEKSGGGILLDQGIHMLDLLALFAEGFDEIQSMLSNLYWNLDDIEDNLFANFRNSKNHVVASLHSTMTQWRHLFSLEIFLEKGYLVLNGLKTPSGTYGEETLTIAKNRTGSPQATWDDEEKINYKLDTSWEDEINDFFNCINNNTPIINGNSEDALKLMQLIDRIYKNSIFNKRNNY